MKHLALILFFLAGCTFTAPQLKESDRPCDSCWCVSGFTPSVPFCDESGEPVCFPGERIVCGD